MAIALTATVLLRRLCFKLNDFTIDRDCVASLEISFQVQLKKHMLRRTHAYSLVVGVCGDGERDHRMLLGAAQLRIGPNAPQNGNRVDRCVG